ncbi:hypothetical protein [Amycolatopsis regifaucium]|uniref:hypothetical protein n=1 Tax=Amycolatopsis regifaucium TaxID=546365 RepID=UPI0008F62426|nr:hypothetical protein [Amycolatopsis regifaucium]SFI41283.1 hypothetical protein SAMN04489731_110201 [Amycolatopsis regifaucium]
MRLPGQAEEGEQRAAALLGGQAGARPLFGIIVVRRLLFRGIAPSPWPGLVNPEELRDRARSDGIRRFAFLAIAWIGAVRAALVIVKPLGLSSRYIEFNRAYSPKINSVGFGSIIVASTISIVAYFGAFSPLLALVVAIALVPAVAIATKGRTYPARSNSVIRQKLAPEELRATHIRTVCQDEFELPDIADCAKQSGAICSLCRTLDATCHDMCRTAGRSTCRCPRCRRPVHETRRRPPPETGRRPSLLPGRVVSS